MEDPPTLTTITGGIAAVGTDGSSSSSNVLDLAALFFVVDDMVCYQKSLILLSFSDNWPFLYYGQSRESPPKHVHVWLIQAEHIACVWCCLLESRYRIHELARRLYMGRSI